MDIEKLISLVFENSCLWNIKQKNYHNRDMSRQKWENVAKEMASNVEAVKNKWRGLRDTFRKELHKQPKKRSGEAPSSPIKEPTWPYFKNMLFLKDQFLPRKLQSSIPELQANTQLENVDGESETVAEDDLDDQTTFIHAEAGESQAETITESSNVTPQPKRAKKTKLNAIEKLLDIEHKKLEEFRRQREASNYTDKSKEGANYHFIMSLVHYLRKVPEERKLAVRMKLQQVFCDEDNAARQQYSYSNVPQYPVETYDRSPQFTDLSTPSEPSSGESTIQEQYGNIASFFSTNNPNQ